MEFETADDGVLRAYSKPIQDIAGLVARYAEENASGLESVLSQNAIYVSQPPRTGCKVCDGALPAAPAFVKQGVGYAFCPACGHVNGLYEDSEAFAHAIYEKDDGAGYAAHYSTADINAFQRRVQAVYRPKVDFVTAALRRHGEDPSRLRYADIGAGSGYYVAALRAAGLQAHGFEASRSQVANANAILGADALSHVALEETEALLRGLDCEVVSMVGVLEHLRHPRAALRALTENPRVRYLFLLVPMYSLSVLFEAAFEAVMPRVLCGDHTHVYTESSLAHMAREFSLRPMAEWWFGSDFADLFRSLSVILAQDPGKAALLPQLQTMLWPLLNGLQGEVDRRKLCSEIHVVYEIRR